MAVEHELRNAAGMTSAQATVAVSQLRSTIVSDEVRQWIKEGRVFQGFEGVLTTEATFAPTTLVRQQPHFMVRVPAGIVMVPLMSQFALQLSTAIVEILVSCCDNDPGTGNHVAITPVNVNTRFSGLNSQCTAYGTSSGNTGTAPSNVADLYREYHNADWDAITAVPTPSFIYAPRDGKGQECVIGDNSNVNAYLFYGLAGTAGGSKGFSIHTWAEFTYAEYYGA